MLDGGDPEEGRDAPAGRGGVEEGGREVADDAEAVLDVDAELVEVDVDHLRDEGVREARVSEEPLRGEADEPEEDALDEEDAGDGRDGDDVGDARGAVVEVPRDGDDAAGDEEGAERVAKIVRDSFKPFEVGQSNLSFPLF